MLQDEALIGFVLMVTLLPVPLWLMTALLLEKPVTAGAGVTKSFPSGAQSMAVSAAFGTLSANPWEEMLLGSVSAIVSY